MRTRCGLFVATIAATLALSLGTGPAAYASPARHHAHTAHVITAPPAPPGITFCGPVEILEADGPLNQRGTEVILTNGAETYFVTTDIGTLREAGITC